MNEPTNNLFLIAPPNDIRKKTIAQDWLATRIRKELVDRARFEEH